MSIVIRRFEDKDAANVGHNNTSLFAPKFPLRQLLFP